MHLQKKNITIKTRRTEVEKRRRIKMNVTKRPLKGGEFLGEGSFGCVFDTMNDCVDKDEQRNINKVKDIKHIRKTVVKRFSDIEDFEEEVSSAQFINKIDQNNLFTVPFIGVCKSKDTSEHIDIDAHYCDKNGELISQQMVYGYGGVDVDSRNKYAEPFNEDKQVVHLSQGLIGLLKGLKVLNDNKICHNDIHEGNLLYDKSIQKFTIIDFGLSHKFENSHRVFFKYWSPPDECIIQKIYNCIVGSSKAPVILTRSNYMEYHNNTHKLKNLLKLIKGSNGKLKVDTRFLNLPPSHKKYNYTETAKTYLLRFFEDNVDVKEKRKQLMIERIEKHDIYSLGHVLDRCMVNLKESVNSKSKYKPLVKTVDTFVKKMCHPDYEKRLHPSTALDIFTAKYKQAVKSIMS